MTDFFVRLLRRETASTEFIPEIDGLRFVSIMMVLLYHINLIISEKSASLNFAGTQADIAPVTNAFAVGFQGVQLFFVISGFILAIPFMRYHFGISDRRLPLGKYFLRRLTRLEPPYILSLILLFVLGLYAARFDLLTGAKSLLLSFFYIHTLAVPGEFPLINNVTWSLEIEVQFYICAPFLVWLICRIRNKTPRRLMLVAAILAASAMAWYLQMQVGIKTWSLALYLQYFLSGVLLCDLYLLENRSSSRFNSWVFFVLGLGILLVIISFDHVASSNLALRILSPLLIFCFYFLTFWNKWWSRIFSLNALTLIGGMCYTIYLLHYWIISAVSNRAVRIFYVENYPVFLFVQMVVMLAIVLAISVVYFVFVEKPCMRKDWPNRLYRFVTNLDRGSRWNLEKQRNKA